MKKLATLIVALAVASCGYSVDEVKDAPERFNVTVAAPWDKVASCIATAYTNDFETVYLPVPSEQRGEIIVKFSGPGIVQYKSTMYDFQFVGGSSTKIIFRSRPPYESAEKRAREAIDKCSKQ